MPYAAQPNSHDGTVSSRAAGRHVKMFYTMNAAMFGRLQAAAF